MGRYFFHLIDGTFQPDNSGTDFLTLDAARHNAVARAEAAIVARGDAFWSGGSFKIVATDVMGAVLFEISQQGKQYPSPASWRQSNWQRDIQVLRGERLVMSLQFTGRTTARDGATLLEAYDGSEPISVFAPPQVIDDLSIEAVKSKAKEKYATGALEPDRSVWVRATDFPMHASE